MIESGYIKFENIKNAREVFEILDFLEGEGFPIYDLSVHADEACIHWAFDRVITWYDAGREFKSFEEMKAPRFLDGHYYYVAVELEGTRITDIFQHLEGHTDAFLTGIGECFDATDPYVKILSVKDITKEFQAFKDSLSG